MRPDRQIRDDGWDVGRPSPSMQQRTIVVQQRNLDCKQYMATYASESSRSDLL